MSPAHALKLVLLICGLAGSGNDLLDYASTEGYWRREQVPATAEAMIGELQATTQPVDVAQLLPELGSTDPEARRAAEARARFLGPAALPELRKGAESVNPLIAAQAAASVGRLDATPAAGAVRRLMVIRTLGELRAAAALPVLHELARSPEPFVAEYAAAAAETIEGRAAPARARAAWVDRDVWLLPDRVRAVLCFAPRASSPLPIDEVVKPTDAAMKGRAQSARDALLAEVLGVAEQFGNLRFDGMTWGLSGEIGERSGYLVGILRGRYDREGVVATLAGRKVPSTTVEQIQVFRPSQETAVFFPSHDRIVFVASPRGGELPLKGMVSAVRANGGGLRTDPEMVRLVQSVDTSQPLWGVARVTDAYRQLPPLAGFDSVTLVASARQAGAYDVKLNAAGRDPAKVRESAEAANAMIAVLRTSVADAGGAKVDTTALSASVGPASEAFLKAFTVRPAGANATADASVSFSRPDLLHLLIDSVRAARAGDVPDDSAPATAAPKADPQESSPRRPAGQ
jgi:hypothetical protein